MDSYAGFRSFLGLVKFVFVSEILRVKKEFEKNRDVFLVVILSRQRDRQDGLETDGVRSGKEKTEKGRETAHLMF